MTKLEYMLREGFIEIEYGERDHENFSRRIKVYLHKTPTRIIDTNMGKAIQHKETGDIMVLDSDTVKAYGAPEALITGLDVEDAIDALDNLA